MKEVTFQTVSRLNEQNGHLIRFLGFLDSVVTIGRQAPFDMPAFASSDDRRSFVRIARELLGVRGVPGDPRLGDLLSEHVRGPLVRKMILLRKLAPSLAWHLEAAPAAVLPVSPIRSKSGLARALQGWAVRSLPEDVLLAAYRKRDLAANGRRRAASSPGS
jgi:hypothetical protein